MAVEVPAAGLSLSESHPLSEELSSLRALVARFQVCIIVHCLSFFWRGSRETVFVLLPSFVALVLCSPVSSWYPADWEGTSRLSLSSRGAVPSLEELGVSIVSSHPALGPCDVCAPKSGRPCCKRDRGQVARGGALQSGLGLQRMRIVKKARTRTGTRRVVSLLALIIHSFPYAELPFTLRI
jgi:hypothetical protein